MVKDLDDVVIRTVSRILVPFIQIYGLYVFVHGHGSPGGGFQGGCIMAASFILLAVAFNLREAKRRLKERTNAIFCALGVFIYAGTGYLSFLYSGNFLDYGKLSNLLPDGPRQGAVLRNGHDRARGADHGHGGHGFHLPRPHHGRKAREGAGGRRE